MQIILSHFLSLDGVAQAPGGPEEDTDGGFAHGGWSHPYFDVAKMGPVIGGVLDRSDAILFGRRTWQVAAAAWPERGGDPFSDKINTCPKYVASRTLTADDLTRGKARAAARRRRHRRDPRAQGRGAAGSTCSAAPR